MTWLKAVRSIVGVLAGYALMGLLITLVQETWFGGVSYTKSSLGVLAVSGFFTFLSAVAGGYIAGLIAGHHAGWHGAVMSLMVACETTWLISSGKTHDPLWFDTAAAGSLVLGLMLGSLLRAAGGAEPRTPVRV
ncbi:MAG TPA: hypothetical protein VFE84_14200 [Patescibacteria group bacterium]|jgi:hypothetical protein|nr:hypothetical protein [Patescibacteria group bacterium]